MSTERQLDAVDYENPEKNTWRKRVHKGIDQVLYPDKKKGVVLYLPGSEDLDRRYFLQKGFREQNLLAVERNPAVAASLRQRGVNVINDDLVKVLECWPLHVDVSVVLADLQCGYDDKVTRIMLSYLDNPSMWGSALLLNLQRGRDANFELVKRYRDKFISSLRDLGAPEYEGNVRKKHTGKGVFDNRLLPSDEDGELLVKHRGFLCGQLFYDLYATLHNGNFKEAHNAVLEDSVRRCIPKLPKKEAQLLFLCEAARERGHDKEAERALQKLLRPNTAYYRFTEIADRFADRHLPLFLPIPAYRSSRVLMDSVIIRCEPVSATPKVGDVFFNLERAMRLHSVALDEKQQEDMKTRIRGINDLRPDTWEEVRQQYREQHPKTCQRIAAALAVRTRRLKNV